MQGKWSSEMKTFELKHSNSYLFGISFWWNFNKTLTNAISDKHWFARVLLKSFSLKPKSSFLKRLFLALICHLCLSLLIILFFSNKSNSFSLIFCAPFVTGKTVSYHFQLHLYCHLRWGDDSQGKIPFALFSCSFMPSLHISVSFFDILSSLSTFFQSISIILLVFPSSWNLLVSFLTKIIHLSSHFHATVHLVFFFKTFVSSCGFFLLLLS